MEAGDYCMAQSEEQLARDGRAKSSTEEDSK